MLFFKSGRKKTGQLGENDGQTGRGYLKGGVIQKTICKASRRNFKTYDKPPDSGWQAPQRPPVCRSHLLFILSGPRDDMMDLHEARIRSSGWALYKTISLGFCHFFMVVLRSRTKHGIYYLRKMEILSNGFIFRFFMKMHCRYPLSLGPGLWHGLFHKNNPPERPFLRSPDKL